MADLSARVVEFLSAGTRTGMLGFVASDGRPLVTPVWFVVDGGELVFATHRDTPNTVRCSVIRESRFVWTIPTRRTPSSRYRGWPR